MAGRMFLQSLFVLLALASAEQDPNAFAYGGSPSSMYWRDSTNILQDLSSFSKLYVTFHSCAWSPYDEEGACSTSDDDDAGGGDSFWYDGNTECFRANVGYSLYGVLAGKSDRGCGKNTYINSFFTTGGVESFTSTMYSQGVVWSSTDSSKAYQQSVTSNCYYNGNSGNNDVQSYGLSCDSYKFVTKTFSGSACNSNEIIETVDTLNALNSYVATAYCMPIYDSSAGNSYGNGNGENNEDAYDGTALSLLAHSRSCSIREFPNSCPDPHGLLASYNLAEERALAKSLYPRNLVVKNKIANVLMALGILLMIGSVLVLCRRLKITFISDVDETEEEPVKKKKKRRGLFGWKSRKDKPVESAATLSEDEDDPKFEI